MIYSARQYKGIYYIGVDPGLNGAIALFQVRPSLMVDIVDMPTKAKVVNKKKKRVLDLYALSDFFEQFKEYRPIRVTIEKPTSMPGDGGVSAFGFGFSCGATEMAIEARRFNILRVPPATWKRDMGLSSKKEDSFKLATDLFPQYEHLWKRKKDDGRAEALLLAYYGARIAK